MILELPDEATPIKTVLSNVTIRLPILLKSTTEMHVKLPYICFYCDAKPHSPNEFCFDSHIVKVASDGLSVLHHENHDVTSWHVYYSLIRILKYAFGSSASHCCARIIMTMENVLLT